MPRARKTLISLEDTSYYHCISRCVRRAFLWGTDYYSGNDYSHRKQWVIERLQQLTDVFAIEVCAYAIMSNHYHLVLHVAQSQAVSWSSEEVIRRWGTLFTIPTLVSEYQTGRCTQAQVDVALDIINNWRERLYDISWFMRCLNEHLARLANAEDNCTGRFWEGRFTSQALLDEAGLLTCMMYVDLNPVRAGIADSPELSDYTSIQQRIRMLQQNEQAPVALKSFHEPDKTVTQPGIPFAFQDYLMLLDWTGRVIRDDKRGAIDGSLPPILQRLNIEPEQWLRYMIPSGNRFRRAIGQVDTLRLYAANIGQQWCQGMHISKSLYSS